MGIPNIIDRIIQQMFKQVLEPICEAKFYNHSYGFRPNRSTSNALGRFESLAGRHSFHYVVDVDIKGFFDNINHTKLIEQMWTLGIRDKRILKLIKKMLKAEIDGEGIPTKGTPQGGVLSPLLANIVLNELDQWVYSQWENFKTHKEYSTKDYRMTTLKKSSTLKQGFLIRYADDFKIMCKSYNDAEKWFYAVKDFLKKRLKHKIVRVKTIQTRKEVHNLNSTILGMQNYYSLATKVNLEFSEIAFKLSKTLRHQLKEIGKYGYPSDANDSYKRNYKGYRMKTYKVCGLWIFPIAGIRHKCKYNFTQKDIHIALHSSDIHKIKEVIKLFDVSTDGIRKFNKYRKELGLEVI